MTSPTRMITYLFRFMLMFEINRFWILGVTNKTISARVGWADDGSPDYEEDEETQDVEWDILHVENMEDALEIAEYLIEEGLLEGDKITVCRGELLTRIGWQKDRFEAAIDALLTIRVDMVDDGRRTDYFFVHF